jgi:flagellar protein FlaG
MNIQTAAGINSGMKIPAEWEKGRATPATSPPASPDVAGTTMDNAGPSYATGVVSGKKSEQTPGQPESPTSMEALQESVEEVEQALKASNNRIAIRIDKDTETPVVQFIDRESGEVVRQMPPEDMLKLRASFKEMLKGLFFNKEV